MNGINAQTFYRARLPDLRVATAVIIIPALIGQAAVEQLDLAFDDVVEGSIFGGQAEPGRLTIEFDPDQLTAEGLVDRINKRTSLVAILDSVELPSAQRPPLSLLSVARYGIWGAVAAGLLWWGGAFGYVRQRLLPQLVARTRGKPKRRASYKRSR